MNNSKYLIACVTFIGLLLPARGLWPTRRRWRNVVAAEARAQPAAALPRDLPAELQRDRQPAMPLTAVRR